MKNQVGIYLPPDLHRAIKAEAATRGMTMSGLIAKILAQHMDRRRVALATTPGKVANVEHC